MWDSHFWLSAVSIAANASLSRTSGKFHSSPLFSYDVQTKMRHQGQAMSQFALVFFAVVSGAFSSGVDAAPQPCEQLAQLALPNTKIPSAQTIAAGAFSPPAAASPWLIGNPSLYKQLPAFCRVTADDKPTPDSDIKIEVWMPASGWNGKFRGQGHGGVAGEKGYCSAGVVFPQ